MSDQPSFLPYGRPVIDEDDVEAVSRVLTSGWLSSGPEVTTYEDDVRAYVGAKHAISCSSGTAGIHLTMMTLDLRPSDVVVVPAVTFLATANTVLLSGGEVVFADVDPDTGLMTAESLDAALTRFGNSVRAVAPVHMTGQVANPASIFEVARERSLKVFDDAAHAFGASYRNRDGTDLRVGGTPHSDATIFSFHPLKPTTMGEGGVVTTDDDDMADRMRLYRNHGMHKTADAFANPDLGLDTNGKPNPWYYEMSEIGYNYRATDIQCALGRSQMKKLDRFTASRTALANHYDIVLAPLMPGVRPIPRVSGCASAWHLYVVLIDFEQFGTTRGKVMRALQQRGVGTQVHYIPLHLQPFYRQRYGEISLRGAETYYRRALTLPLAPDMTPADVENVAGALAEVLGIKS